MRPRAQHRTPKRSAGRWRSWRPRRLTWSSAPPWRSRHHRLRGGARASGARHAAERGLDRQMTLRRGRIGIRRWASSSRTSSPPAVPRSRWSNLCGGLAASRPLSPSSIGRRRRGRSGRAARRAGPLLPWRRGRRTRRRVRVVTPKPRFTPCSAPCGDPHPYAQHDGIEATAGRSSRMCPPSSWFQGRSEIEGAFVKVHGSGRTDAGVHALGQVAAFTLRNRIPCPNLRKAMNRPCRRRRSALEAEEAAGLPPALPRPGSKTYEYRIWRDEVCPDAAALPLPLPLPARRTAHDRAGPAVRWREHDFTAFAAARRQRRAWSSGAIASCGSLARGLNLRSTAFAAARSLKRFHGADDGRHAGRGGQEHPSSEDDLGRGLRAGVSAWRAGDRRRHMCSGQRGARIMKKRLLPVPFLAAAAPAAPPAPSIYGSGLGNDIDDALAPAMLHALEAPRRNPPSAPSPSPRAIPGRPAL